MKSFILWLITCRITYLLRKKGFGEGVFFYPIEPSGPLCDGFIKERLFRREYSASIRDFVHSLQRVGWLVGQLVGWLVRPQITSPQESPHLVVVSLLFVPP
jgi:hypothetical protein